VAVKVVESEAGVGLAFEDAKRGKPYYVDFLTVAWRSNFQKGLPKAHIFRRALGVQAKPLKILDATAGFGQDSALMLSMGCNVIALERSKEVARVLRDGIERAVREDELFKTKFKNMKVIESDAREWLKNVNPSDAPDVVYIDPMFDKPKKSAKSPKEMQLLQELLGTAPSSEEEIELLTLALNAAKSRVVVKRPLKARALISSPAHSYKGQSIRYDVYVK
jgi:16S rRNA (guanine1516-N2)-methyltransferase